MTMGHLTVYQQMSISWWVGWLAGPAVDLSLSFSDKIGETEPQEWTCHFWSLKMLFQSFKEAQPIYIRYQIKNGGVKNQVDIRIKDVIKCCCLSLIELLGKLRKGAKI